LRNFRWQIKGVLAGSNIPKRRRHYARIVKEGIRVVVTLTENPLKAEAYAFLEPKDITLHHCPVIDHTAATLEQLHWFVKLVDKYRAKNLPVLVHCKAGCGRAGTFLTAYLIHSEKLSAQDAYIKMRKKIRGINRFICWREPNKEQRVRLGEFAEFLQRH
jgi:atypical dual specificity phosphatase